MVITTVEQLNEMVAYYLEQDSFAFDIETMGEHAGNTILNDVVWISFATYGRVDVIPMGHPNGDFENLIRPLTGQGAKRQAKGLTVRDADYSRDDKKATKTFTSPPVQLFPKQVFQALEPLFFSDKLKIGHNIIFDITSIAKYYGNRVVAKPYFDTLVGSFIFDTRNKGKLGLDDCLKRELDYHMVKGVGKDIAAHSFDEVAKYSALDSKYTWLLYRKVQEHLEERNLMGIMRLEMDVLYVLCHMKLEGAPIDMVALSQLKIDLEKQIEDKRADIYRAAGRHFNINSVKEKQALLYKPRKEGGLGLKTQIVTSSAGDKPYEELQWDNFSTSAEALQSLIGRHEIIQHLVDYQDLNKLLTTYVIPYLGGEVTKTVNGESKTTERESLLVKGRVHGDFVQHGAETGRFSSKNPNLQNVPNPATANGRAVRNLFVAPPGYKLVVADYSQIEPRIIASLSKDETMLSAYTKGEDIYKAVASKMGVDRAAGKVLVLSISYGVGPDKVARTIGCKVQEARDLINNFAKEFKSVGKYKSKVISIAENVGFVKTVMGRRRYITDINSRDRIKKGSADRQAFNTVIQGTAADIMKLAMVRAHQMIPKESRLILTVHDELVTLTPEHLATQTEEAIRGAMEGVNLLDVPLIADVKVVDRWGEAK
jgi:DNA polymerase I-like protein with 3'-5' exonuclease and polymerase domains